MINQVTFILCVPPMWQQQYQYRSYLFGFNSLVVIIKRYRKDDPISKLTTAQTVRDYPVTNQQQYKG